MGDVMKKTATLLLACTALGVAAQASAQSLSRGWDTYRQQQKQQQAGAQGATHTASTSQAGTGAAPPVARDSATEQVGGGFTTVTADAPAVAAPVAPAPASSDVRTEEPRIDSGAFIGVQGGRSEVFEGLRQDMLGANVGYRWRAGAVTLVGIEAFAGYLERIRTDDAVVPSARFAGLGGTARFNFGDSPVFALVRLGYWGGESVGYDGDRFYGAYLGAGLGVDLGRHVSLSAQYTNYVYSSDYNAEDIEINRADVLNAALELRF